MKKSAVSPLILRLKRKALIRRKFQQYAHLTPERFVAEAQKAGAEAAQRTLDNIGFIVVSHNGWVVKKYKDGRIEQLEKI